VSNVWLFAHDSKRFLVDTGHVAERVPLLVDLWRSGVRRAGDLDAILLTHRHSDHAGNAAWLRRKFRCPVICHEADADVLAGRAPPPPMARRNGARLYEELLCRFEDFWPARCEVDEVFSPRGDWRSGFQVVPVPGHTEGSVM